MITDEYFFDLFTAHGVTRQEIAQLNLETVTRQITELRQGQTDDLDLPNSEIAQRILDFARD